MVEFTKDTTKWLVEDVWIFLSSVMPSWAESETLSCLRKLWWYMCVCMYVCVCVCVCVRARACVMYNMYVVYFVSVL